MKLDLSISSLNSYCTYINLFTKYLNRYYVPPIVLIVKEQKVNKIVKASVMREVVFYNLEHK